MAGDDVELQMKCKEYMSIFYIVNIFGCIFTAIIKKISKICLFVPPEKLVTSW